MADGGTFDETGAQVVRFSPGYSPTYKYVKDTPGTTWTIIHNIGKYPSITCQDGSGNIMEPDIAYPSASEVILTFSTAVSGTAFLN